MPQLSAKAFTRDYFRKLPSAMALRQWATPRESFRDLRQMYDTYRMEASPDAYPLIAARLAGYIPLRDQVIHPPLVWEFDKLRGRNPFTALTIDRELQWAAAYLSCFQGAIRRFAALKSEYEFVTLRGDLDRCIETLCNIETQVGFSMWHMQQTIALCQEVGGLQAQKEAIRAVKKAAPRSGIVNTVLHFTSMRNEPSVTAQGFVEAVDGILSEHLRAGVPAEYVSYIGWVLLPLGAASPDVLAQALWMHVPCPIIDYYVGTHRIAKSLSASVQSPFRGLAAQVLSDLDALTGNSFNGEGDDSTIRQGKDPTCASAFAYIWRKAIARASVPIRAGSEDDEPAPGTREAAIVANLNTVFSGGGELESASNELLKLSLNYAPAPWADALLATVLIEKGDDPVSEAWLRRWRSLDGECAALERGDSHGLGDSVRAVLSAGASTAEGNYIQALQLCPNQSPETSAYVAIQATRIRVRCLCAVGGADRVAEAVRAIVRCALAYPSVAPTLPLRQLLSVLTSLQLRERTAVARCGPFLSVFYDLCERHLTSAVAIEKRHAMEDWLTAIQVRYPSRLSPDVVSVELSMDECKRVLCYFLVHVCVEPLLAKNTRVFRDSRAVLEERLAICRRVMELDPAQALPVEIAAILRRLMIQKGLSRVARSRVFVDTAGVKAVLRQRIREQLARFQALAEVSTWADAPEAEAVRSALRDAQEGKYEDLLLLRLPKNEPNEILARMVNLITDEFARGAVHGLDGYLSVRVRHGTLSNHLRAPLSEAGVITEHDSQGAYLVSASWVAFVSGWPEELATEIHGHLRLLSRDFDELLNLMGTAWLQVSTPTERGPLEAMFRLQVPENQVALLSFDARNPATKADDFIDLVLSLLGIQLDAALYQVRERLNSEGRRLAVSLLDRAHDSVEKSASRHFWDAAELLNTIRSCKVNLNAAFDRAVEWFHRAPEIADDPFHLDDLIRVSAEVVRSGLSENERFSIVIAPSLQGLLMPGRTFQPLVDLLVIAIGNAIQHCGFSDIPTTSVRVSLDTTPVGTRLDFEVRNNVDSSVRQVRESRLRATRELLSNDGRLSFVGREGGSGILKLHKLLSFDLSGSAEALDFGFADDGEYYLRFGLPISLRAENSQEVPS